MDNYTHKPSEGQYKVYRNSEYIGLVETLADVLDFIEQDRIEQGKDNK